MNSQAQRSNYANEEVQQRSALFAAWIALTLITLMVILVVLVRIVVPRPVENYGMRLPVELGQFQVSEWMLDPPRKTARDRVWVVDTESGWIALENRSPHRGCRMKWKPEPARFVDPCHGQVHLRDGRYARGPNLSDMRRLPLVAVGLDGGMFASDGGDGDGLKLPDGLAVLLIADLADPSGPQADQP